MEASFPTTLAPLQPEFKATKRSRRGKDGAVKSEDTAPTRRDDFIMDTNNSSIVSKRSVEKLYYSGEPEYIRYFVSKYKRRSPLINRGYWLRMKAIEHTVSQFLRQTTTKAPVVVNLGCGYDTLPFMFLGRGEGKIFIDVDYPQLMLHKVGVIDNTPAIKSVLPSYALTGAKMGLLARSRSYLGLGCDMNSANQLNKVMDEALAELRLSRQDVAFLFIAEVSIAYMELDASQAILKWAAGLEDAWFCLLEQHLPDGNDHPFAQTMLSHFRKLRTPLNAIGTLDQMRQRFVNAGFPERGIDLRTLWEVWADAEFLTDDQRRALDKVEPFDEWEEFALFGAHYFLMVARTRPGDSGSVTSNKTRSAQPDKTLHVSELSGPTVPRRFAALVSAERNDSTLGLLAGLGTQERRVDCDTYCSTEDAHHMSSPALRVGLQCHTVTPIGRTRDILLVGGRTSPNEASTDSWVRRGNSWSRSHTLETGRFRHCAVGVSVPAVPSPIPGVLVFGGKTSKGEVLDSWMLWTADGWKTLEVVYTGCKSLPRFGASMITDVPGGTSGILIGGMDDAGRIARPFLCHWSIAKDLKIHCHDMTDRAWSVLKDDYCILGRFGAQLVRSSLGILLVGGICADRMLTREEEILNMKTLQMHPIRGELPMLIGFSIANVDDNLLVLGGGATCFSFGTHWTRPCLLTLKREQAQESKWRLLPVQHSAADIDGQGNNEHILDDSTVASVPLKESRVPRVPIAKDFWFENFLTVGRPVVFTNSSIGSCTAKWDAAYLREKVGAERKVVIHASSSTKMDFQKKNFEYITRPFGDFIAGIAKGEQAYVRALSKDAPSKKPTTLAEDYPEIANDFMLPKELRYVVDHQHSSPLRISGSVSMWLHYDVMANVLCQVRGMKRVLLFAPTDVGHLDFAAGASSSSLNAFHPNNDEQVKLSKCHAHEAVLEPGDILFIPPMWIHTAEPTEGMSVAVNVFFRSLEDGSYAAGRDVYGNRDLAAYERGRKDIARIIKSFQDLPADISGFYLQRLGHEVLEEARRLSQAAPPN